MKRRWRLLTAGEIAMASLLFRDAIDYTRVRVFRRRYLPYLQPENCLHWPRTVPSCSSAAHLRW